MKKQNIFLLPAVMFFGTIVAMNQENLSTPVAALAPWSIGKKMLDILQKNNELLEQANELKKQELDLEWVKLIMTQPTNNAGVGRIVAMAKINYWIDQEAKRLGDALSL